LLLAPSSASRKQQPLALRPLAPRRCRPSGKGLRRALFAAMFGASAPRVAVPRNCSTKLFHDLSGQRHTGGCRSDRASALKRKPDCPRYGTAATLRTRSRWRWRERRYQRQQRPKVTNLTLAHGRQPQARLHGCLPTHLMPAPPRLAQRSRLRHAMPSVFGIILLHRAPSQLTRPGRARAEGEEEITASGRCCRPTAGGAYTCLRRHLGQPRHPGTCVASAILLSSRLSLLSYDARPLAEIFGTDHDKSCTSWGTHSGVLAAWLNQLPAH
jgi:hypothetical protein